MARNSEVVRQWEILRGIDSTRHGISITRLAAVHGVHARTIRRDVDALSRAGFPLFDQKVNGTSMWMLRARPFRQLEELGLSLTETCALYFSRSMLNTLAGSPLLDETERAFLKIEKALPPGCRTFLDQLPRVLQSKPHGRKKQDARKFREILARVLDATLRRRRGTMRYASASSRRTKEYVIEAQRIAYAEGGIYLVAWVPEYGEMRTFAAERILTFAVLDETFDPQPLPAEPFPNSLGVNSGAPQKIVIEFEPDAARYIREREWHPSQRLEDRPDSGTVLTMHVCNDRPLRAWVLGFGASACVVEPASLAEEIFETANATRARYFKSVSKTRIELLSIRAS
jgi:predicted DNA-binding transcriptional regulator YafY